MALQTTTLQGILRGPDGVALAGRNPPFCAVSYGGGCGIEHRTGAHPC